MSSSRRASGKARPAGRISTARPAQASRTGRAGISAKTLNGAKVRITAVLERTCVYVDGDGDRRLARKRDLWVEADKLPIRRRGIG